MKKWFSVLLIYVVVIAVIFFLFSHINSRINRKSIHVQTNQDQPVIALTFDDGPDPYYTLLLLDILYQQQVPATFFVTGKNIQSYPQIIKEMINSGHELENHTFSHPDLTTISKKQIKQEIALTQQAINAIDPDYQFRFIRPPYSHYNHTVLQASPLPLLLWTLDSGDWQKKDSQIVIQTVCNNVKDQDIIIFHDDNINTINAIKVIIPTLKARGYQFLTVNELYQHSKKI